ncbi:phospho-2-dehydro-3-deoxyheptonate aldolase [Actinocatenispora thailandica]|uniref:Phospho-2-dehydro-3-deoxyheptonate aldolase n=1 Tax=Actinocatenispora thailandica TaxID=227318 RepID=A0A7R7I037_9ACTN|nr:3-deoxy-7-phosphoheptulonate synthase [Actinocatenispora thailandica]BCJ38992.1 phospho-2-dehydro-3-deoxyheptonate aldolase [Actinocatenispora thailandica]
MEPLRDRRIASVRPLVQPALLAEELPITDHVAGTVRDGRRAVIDVLSGTDDRLLVIVGPCSVHDPAAALEYAQRLAGVADRLRDDLAIVMRVYFEKPRTVVGWKGLLNDPRLDGSFEANEGLRLGRRLLLDIGALGLPVGCEYLDPILPQYLADAVSWGAIGARTAESQVHRQLASGLSMPIGIKNGTDGGVGVAIDAVRAAAVPHVFPGVTEHGVAAIMQTAGNPDCHVILRGGRSGPNFGAEPVAAALGQLRDARLPERVIIDCSHGNSGKDHARQPLVAADVAGQLAAGQRGIVGVMLESFLVDGRQSLGIEGGSGELTYGQSVTDACLGWETTVPVLDELAGAVRARRSRVAGPAAVH